MRNGSHWHKALYVRAVCIHVSTSMSYHDALNAFPSFDKVLLHTPFATVKLESDGWLVNWPLAVGLVGHR